MDSIESMLKGFARIPRLTHEEEVVYGKASCQWMRHPVYGYEEMRKRLPSKPEFPLSSPDIRKTRWIQCLDKNQRTSSYIAALKVHRDHLHSQAIAYRFNFEEAEQVHIEGRIAQKKLIAANMRLVVSIAKKFQRHAPLTDLTQEGVRGLVRAAELFDPERGCRFSTYAYRWILQAIRRSKGINNVIKLPCHVQEKLEQLARLERLGRLKDEVAAEKLGVGVEELRSYRSRKVFTLVDSLDRFVGRDENVPLYDFVAYEESQYLDPFVEGAISEAFKRSRLSPLQIVAIKLRLGLTRDGVHHDYGEIASILAPYYPGSALDRQKISRSVRAGIDEMGRYLNLHYPEMANAVAEEYGFDLKEPKVLEFRHGYNKVQA